MQSSMTQKEIVAGCLNNGETLTRAKMEAYGICRLSHYIWLLKKEGMKIGRSHKDEFTEPPVTTIRA